MTESWMAESLEDRISVRCNASEMVLLSTILSWLAGT